VVDAYCHYRVASSVRRAESGPQPPLEGGEGIDGGELRHGFTIRPIMTIGIASIAGRYGHVFGADRGAHFGEVSVLLKFPIVLVGEPW